MAAFDHVMENVLGRAVLRSALESEGIQDIYALLTLDEETIDALSHSDEEGTTSLPLPRGDRNLIKVFLGYYRYRSATGDPIDDWLQVTIGDLENPPKFPTGKLCLTLVRFLCSLSKKI